jgi:hypothetical protein
MPDAWMVLDEEGKQEMVDADDLERFSHYRKA